MKDERNKWKKQRKLRKSRKFLSKNAKISDRRAKETCRKKIVGLIPFFLHSEWQLSLRAPFNATYSQFSTCPTPSDTSTRFNAESASNGHVLAIAERMPSKYIELDGPLVRNIHARLQSWISSQP